MVTMLVSWISDKSWTYAQISLLWELAKDKTPLSEISAQVGKTPDEICKKAADLGITLTPGSRESIRQERVNARKKEV